MGRSNGGGKKRPYIRDAGDYIAAQKSRESISSSSSGTHSRQEKDGSTHVTHTTDGAHVSYNAQKDGSTTAWHGTIHDTTGKGENIIVERKSDQK